ncbi:DNA-binding protein [Micromonosporaceae bacterium B7E4]
MNARQPVTADEIRALGVRTDLVTACRIVLGCGKNKAWELYHADELPFPALRCGRRVIVPTAPVIELLGLADSPAPK